MTFKARLITFIFSAATLVMAVFFAIAYISLDIAESRFSEEAVRGKSVLWQKVIQVQLETMEASSSSMTRARDLLKALRKSNIEKVAEAALPTYNRLSTSNVISRLQIADKSGSIIFSAPNNYTGKTVKTLVKKAFDEKKVFKGIERDDDGVMMAEVAFPLYFRGKAAGVAIYMRKLDAAISNFKDADGSEVHLTSQTGAVEASTNMDQFKSIQVEMDSDGKAQQYKQKFDDKIYSLVQLPVQDASENLTANLLITTDYTSSFDKQSNIYLIGIFSGLVAFFCCMIFIYWYINRSFNPMKNCLTVMGHIASGNLTDKISVESSDEFGQLLQSVKDMQSKLKGMINDINTATQQIEISAGNLDSVTHDSSERVSSQQQVVQQLVHDIDQLMQASINVNHVAEESTSDTQKAETEVTNGRNVIIEGVKTIQNISEQINQAETIVKEVHNGTESIGSVLDVIKGIAEQTNLLALNAAIEAARAGEQGRGFAVVADEVRTLASRTQESTTEIETMIEALQKGASSAVSTMTDSIDMVKTGVEMSQQADQSFGVVTERVISLNEKSAAISSAASRQKSLSQEMNDNVASINRAAEQAVEGNKTTVQSSDDLLNLAETLRQKVSQFHT